MEILIKAPAKELPRDQQQIDLNSEQQSFKTLRDQKLEDIELLFINMHHLINELRPHQARDNIRCILEMQKRQRIETAQKFKVHLFKIVEILKLCIQSIKSNNNNNSNDDNSNDIIKSDIFLDELRNLMQNATDLTKTLDNIDSLTNTNNKKLNVDQHDIDMTPVTENDDELDDKSDLAASIKLINSNLNKKQPSNNGSHTIDQQQLVNSNCDFKDLILCDLIDDFLLKENEF